MMGSVKTYRHPDGFDISFAPGLVIATNDAGESIPIPIGLHGLLKPADQLSAISDDAAELAEQAGAGIAMAYLKEMLAAKTPGARMEAMHAAVLELQRHPHPKPAAGGFGMALVDVLERGLGLFK